MTDAITKHGDYTSEQLDLIKTQICKGASDAQLGLFVATCERLALDPFARQVYAVMRENKKAGTTEMTIQVSIDGFRAVAEASGDYQGQTASQWCGDDGEWKDVWLSKEYPAAARVGVWRAGFREPLYAVATWLSYMQGYDGNPSPMWAKFPDVMLAKCAESLALRKAFPRKLSGLYTPDEMAQAEPATAAISVIPREQTYEDPKQADEKGRVKFIAEAYCAEVLPELEDRQAQACQEMVECDDMDDAQAGDMERKAITACHRAYIRDWCDEQRPRVASVFAHPATSNAKAKLWLRLRHWAEAAKVPVDDVRAMLANKPEEEAAQ